MNASTSSFSCRRRRRRPALDARMFLYRTSLALIIAFIVTARIHSTQAQLLSADFTQCLQDAAQAPDDQKLNINRVYAQLDTGRESGGSDGDNTDHQALLRLVAQGETGVQSQGFSNETNYLGRLVHLNVTFRKHLSNMSSCLPSQPLWSWRLRSCRSSRIQTRPRYVRASSQLQNSSMPIATSLLPTIPIQAGVPMVLDRYSSATRSLLAISVCRTTTLFQHSRLA